MVIYAFHINIVENLIRRRVKKLIDEKKAVQEGNYYVMAKL